MKWAWRHGFEIVTCVMVFLVVFGVWRLAHMLHKRAEVPFQVETMQVVVTYRGADLSCLRLHSEGISCDFTRFYAEHPELSPRSSR